MELYEIANDAEQILRSKADRNKIPLGGAIELLPLCNMACKMCYVRKNKTEMDAEGRMLSCDEWLSIAEQARDAGVLFLLLTGGEPLLYPEFKRLYRNLLDMGIILTVNTNGTLIDEEWADFFARYPCRCLNITIYGKDSETYKKLCNNPKGFSQIMEAARLLKERDVAFRFNCSLTNDNVEELRKLYEIADEFEVPLRVASYMFPALRKGVSAEEQERMAPERAAQTTFQTYQVQKNQKELEYAVYSTLASLGLPPKISCASGYTCHAGHSGFWMNWKGELLPCGMLLEPKINLTEYSFEEAWKYIVDETQKIDYCKECKKCKWQNICHVCPANLLAESGSFQKRPDYICRYTKELIKQMFTVLSEDERIEIQAYLGKDDFKV